MKERPILFSGEMVKAILDGIKTQTRRVIKNQPIIGPSLSEESLLRSRPMRRVKYEYMGNSDGNEISLKPFAFPGDQLWVKESFALSRTWDDRKPGDILPDPGVEYKAGGTSLGNNVDRLVDRGKWRPSIFMPRWASRITLEVKDIRVERLQKINESDARAEGLRIPVDEKGHALICVTHPRPVDGIGFKAEFASLWEQINSKRGYGWEVNPFVWVVEFERL